ncbi:hypothetical protein BH11BAC4_BH11BAC4_08020 [soil metagenome]
MNSFLFHCSKQVNAFKQLHSLEGKWIMKTKRGMIGEEWVKVNESHVHGKGFFIKGADTIVTERIALIESGRDIFYTSTVED